MAMNRSRRNVRLAPDVSRILYVRNLPYKISSEEMYDIFGKYGPIRQIRLGNIRGTALVIYENIFDAINAHDNLNGINVCNRYLVVCYYQVKRASVNKVELDKKNIRLEAMKAKYGLATPRR